MFRRMAVVVVLGVLAAGCAREVEPAREGEGPRIVALSPAIAIILKDLGVEGRIVGRHGYDMVLDPDVPICGDQAGIDYEQLLTVRPTHVLTQWGARPPPERLVRLAERHGWVLVDVSMLSLDEVAQATRRLARDFAPERVGVADELTGFRPPAGVFKGRVLLLATGSPPAALGPGSFHQDLLERLGATAAVSEGSAYIVLDAEDVLRLDPEGIIVLASRAGEGEGVVRRGEAALAALGPFGSLPIRAVETGRVAVIEHPLALMPGTSLVEIRQAMAEILVGWAAGP